MRQIIWSAGLLFSTIFSPAVATETGYPTDNELRTLPPYCHAKLRAGPRSADYKYWNGIIGTGFDHVHHFCQGLNLINRYYTARSSYDRKYYLGASLGEFGYMITHAPPTGSLMPEVYLNRGFALWKLKRDGEAIKDFLKALELNPRFARSYVVLSDFYAEKKLKDKALATLTEGLKHVPDSKMLQRRYLELGGKKPFPEPYQAPAIEEPVTEPSGVDSSNVPPPPPVNMEQGSTQPSSAAPETDTATNPPQPAIGVPGNPWCRFCPEPAPEKGNAGTPTTPGNP